MALPIRLTVGLSVYRPVVAITAQYDGRGDRRKGKEWAGFRARETAALEAVTAPSTVIATGGGIILTEFNRHFMQNNGIVVYLCAPVSVLVNRLQAAPEEDLRPTLTGKPLSEEVQEVLEERDALYREVAHIIIDATNEPSQVISEIRSALAQTINC